MAFPFYLPIFLVLIHWWLLYMCVYTHIYTYTHTHTYIHTHIYIHIYTHMYIYTHIYIYTYIFTLSIFLFKYTWFGLPSGHPDLGSVVKNPLANAGDVGDAGSTSGFRRSPGGGNGNPLQYSCLENPRSLAGNRPQCRKESDTSKRLSIHAYWFTMCVNFCYIAKWFSYMYILLKYILFPLWFVKGY